MLATNSSSFILCCFITYEDMYCTVAFSKHISLWFIQMYRRLGFTMLWVTLKAIIELSNCVI